MRLLIGGILVLIGSFAAAASADPTFALLGTVPLADDGAERLALAPVSRLVLSTAPRQNEIHLHRIDWAGPGAEVVDAFPPTDALTAIPTPGRPTAVAAHPVAPLAVALSSPKDVRSRGEVLLLDLRERSYGRLLRSQLVGYEPNDVAISSDGQWALVANRAGSHRRTPGSIGVLDMRTLAGWENNRLQELTYRELGGLSNLIGRAAGRLQPDRISIEPRGRLAAVTLGAQDAVVWVDLRGAEPELAGTLRLPPGSKPAGIGLLDQPEGSILAVIAEKGAQRVSVFEVSLHEVPASRLLARIDIRPWVNPRQPARRRDPDTILVGRAAGRPSAWLACDRTDRILWIDLADPANPSLLARRAAQAPPRSLIRVETPVGARLVSGNGDGTISVMALDPVP